MPAEAPCQADRGINSDELRSLVLVTLFHHKRCYHILVKNSHIRGVELTPANGQLRPHLFFSVSKTR